MSFTAKSIILDVADNWGDPNFTGLRSLDMYLSSVLQDIAAPDIAATYGGFFSVSYQVDFAFITALPKTGPVGLNSWLSGFGVHENIRVICVFTNPQTFDEIIINNVHDSGAQTDYGTQNVKITISDDAISDTTYNAAVANSTVVYDSTFDEHVAADVQDDQILVLAEPPIVITPPPFITTTTLSAGVLGPPIVITPPPFITTTTLSAGFGVSINPPAFITGTTLLPPTLSIFSRQFSSIFYIFTLTGSPDIEIPISNFQTRLRDGDPSYLQVTIPDADKWLTAVTDRANGEMRVDMAFKFEGDLIRRDTIAVADLEQIDPVYGPVSQSIVLSGHKTEVFTPKAITVPIANAATRFVAQGNLSYRIAVPVVDMNPGDEVTIGNDTFDARLISYFISVGSQFQTVSA